MDKLYDEIEEIETSIEAVETRLYNIKQEKISGDNVYHQNSGTSKPFDYGSYGGI